MEKYGVMDGYKCTNCGQKLILRHGELVPAPQQKESEVKTAEHVHDFKIEKEPDEKISGI
jgi:DNA-directed RNA polymerase subunit RPC12/RpoP